MKYFSLFFECYITYGNQSYSNGWVEGFKKLRSTTLEKQEMIFMG